MSSSDKGSVAAQLTVAAVLTAIGSLLVPLVFGRRIEVSPFLLFAIVVVCNLAQTFVPEPAERTTHTALRLFWVRLAVSGLFSLLLVVIYRLARGVA